MGALLRAAPEFLSGLLVTIGIGLGAAALAAVMAFGAGLASTARWRLLRIMARLYLTFQAQMFNQQTLHTSQAFLTILVIYFLLAKGVGRGFALLDRRVNRWTLRAP